MAISVSPEGSLLGFIAPGKFKLPSTFTGAAQAGKAITVHFKAAKNPEYFARLFEKKFAYGDGPNDPRTFLMEFGEQVKDVILAHYDVTRSTKPNTKRTGKFRESITVMGPFYSSRGDLTVSVGAKILSFWPMLEYGVSPNRRVQEFEVVGSISSTSGIRSYIGTGKTYPSVKTLKHYRERQHILKARYGEESAEFRGFPNYPNMPQGLKLIRRSKEDLARIDRKVKIEFMHPGFPAGHFIRAGVRHIMMHGDEFFAKKWDIWLKGLREEADIGGQFKGANAVLRTMQKPKRSIIP